MEALSQFDTQYALFASAGIPMRYIDRSQIERCPETRPTAKDQATAVREDVKVLQARMPHVLFEPAGVAPVGEISEVTYRDYIDAVLEWGVLKQKVETGDVESLFVPSV